MPGIFNASIFNNAIFNTGGAPPIAPIAPNGNRRIEYVPTYYELESARQKLKKYRNEEMEAQAELLSIDYKLEDLELKRLRDLADEAMQLELLALLKQQQLFQKILSDIQTQKEILRREDEEFLMVFACLPFNA